MGYKIRFLVAKWLIGVIILAVFLIGNFFLANPVLASNPPTITTTSLPSILIGSAYSQTLQATGGTAPYAWNIFSGSLPENLILNSSTGIISGTPVLAGTFNFIVQVIDADAQSSTQALSISVFMAPTISSPNSLDRFPIGTINQVYPEQILSVGGGTAPFTWSLIGGNLPPGLTLSSDGHISGTPTSTGYFTFTVQVQDSYSLTDTHQFYIGIAPPSTTGFVYTRTPAGDTILSPITIRIQGIFGIDFCSYGTTEYHLLYYFGSNNVAVHYSTPTPGQVIDDTFQVNLAPNSYGSVYLSCDGGLSRGVESGFTIVETPVPTPSPNITTTSLPTANVGATYSQTLQVINGTMPFAWSIVSGNLPAGLSLNSPTGEISGTPTMVETANFTVLVTDINNQIATKDLSITVHGNTPTGSNIVVSSNGTTLTFSNVTQEGQTTITQSSSGAQPPSGFKLGTPPTYYSISTTALFTGSVEVCLIWQEGQFNKESNLKLFHYDGTNWTNITESGYPDTMNNVICGLTTSFSYLAIFEKKQIEATVDIKPGSYPNSINLGSGGTVPVAIFSTPTFDARTIDPLTITLASAPVKLKGNGTLMSSFQDVNSDSLLDLVVHVSTEALQLSFADEMADLVGYTSDSTEVIGSDTVRVVP